MNWARKGLNPLAVGVGIQRSFQEGGVRIPGLNPLAVGVGIQPPS